MKRHSRRIGKRLLASLLSALMVLSMLPVNTLAEEIETTSDIGQLMTDLVVEGDGLTQNEDGSYNVRAKEPYNLKMTFVENDKLEFDMDASISFELPKGVAALFASGSTDIYVSLASATVSITNDYVVDVVADVNVITITWNKDDKYFQDLAAAHYVNFVFDMNLEFDGTTDIVTFNSGKDIIFNVDTSGKVIVEKAISGIDPAKLSEEQKNAMTFALMRKGKGENEDDTIVGTFSYAQMTNGKFEYSPLEPGDYYVVETGNPTVPLYYLDTANSTTTKEGTLEPAG